MTDNTDIKVIDSLLNTLKEDPYPCTLAKNALSTLSALLSSDNDDAITFVVNKGIIQILCDILKDNKEIQLLSEIKPMIIIALDMLEYILSCGKRKHMEISFLNGNQFKHEIIQHNGYHYMCQIVDNNQNNDTLYQKARHLIMEYFADDKIPKIDNINSDITTYTQSTNEFNDSKLNIDDNNIYNNVSELFGEEEQDLNMAPKLSYGAVNELFPIAEAETDSSGEIQNNINVNNQSQLIQLIDDILVRFEL
eukprot:174057_1